MSFYSNIEVVEDARCDHDDCDEETKTNTGIQFFKSINRTRKLCGTIMGITALTIITKFDISVIHSRIRSQRNIRWNLLYKNETSQLHDNNEDIFSRRLQNVSSWSSNLFVNATKQRCPQYDTPDPLPGKKGIGKQLAPEFHEYSWTINLPKVVALDSNEPFLIL